MNHGRADGRSACCGVARRKAGTVPSRFVLTPTRARLVQSPFFAGSGPRVCAAALDQGYVHGTRVILARIGLQFTRSGREWTGVKAPQPQAPAPAMEPVDVLRIDKMRPPHGQVQRVLPRGRRDEMDVVRHQAVSQHPHPVLLALLAQQPQVRDTVPIHKEHVVAVIPPLRDRMRQPRYDDARLSSHATRILELEGKVNNRWLSYFPISDVPGIGVIIRPGASQGIFATRPRCLWYSRESCDGLRKTANQQHRCAFWVSRAAISAKE